MEVIELRDILIILYKRKWIIIFITTFSLIISGLISYFVMKPVYETYTTLIIGNLRNNSERMDYSDSLLNQRLTNSYREIAKSKTVVNEVINNLNLNIDYKDFEKKVMIQIVKDTEIIKVVVEDKNPELAAQIANEVSEILIMNVKRIMDIENIYIVDRAEVPVKHIKPRPILNMAVSVTIGTLMSLVFILVSEYLDVTVKTADDIERHLLLPVIGMIPQLQRGKKDKKQSSEVIIIGDHQSKLANYI